MAPSAAADTKRFRSDVEGLRAVAVVLVVAFHARIAPMSGGFIGVDVFFVLSGFLITGILVRQLERDGRIKLMKFFSRRMLRLLPAAMLMLVATIVAERLLLSPVERIELSSSAIATALYSSNLYFMVRAADYFAADVASNPLVHTWSLAVEEQFYLVWPLLLLVTWRIGRSRRRLGVALGVIAVLSFAGEVWLTHKKQPWAFFGTPARAWEFGLGGIVALLPVVPVRGRVAMRWLGWGGLAVVVASAIAITETTNFPGTAALAPVLGTSAVLIAGSVPDARGAGWLLDRRAMQWLGRHSYSWYLWHWPILVLGPVLLVSTSLPTRIVLVAVSLATAAATTALIENPIRFHPSLIARPALVLRAGAVVSLAAAVIAFVAYRDSATKGERYARAASELSGLDSAGCAADFIDTHPRICVFGDSASPMNVVLFGDSHATQWFPALERMERDHRWRLTTLVKFSCPAARFLVFNSVLGRRYTECEAWREEAIRRIIALRPSAVIIGQMSNGYAEIRPDGSTALLAPAGWGAGVRATVARFDAAGIRTILFRDSPRPGLHVPQCLSSAEEGRGSLADCAVARAV
ncbi:MAG TPA: acyltransferase family protein, partial [Candidatus Elarobacter sp.]|nr:acyltransferase family protein [Candidatus Elarobacter sp.]